METLREIKTLYKFFKTPKALRQIVFYAEHAGYFSHLEGLVKELTEKLGQSIAYVTSSPKDPILQTKNPNIKAFYINRLLPFFMQSLNTKVCVMTLNDFGEFHLKRSHHPVHYVYVMHSLASTHMVFREKAYDHYDSMLCAGPYHVKEVRKREELHNLKQKTLVECGYYPLERLHENYKNSRVNSRAKKTVLIAPSWGEENILESCGQELVDALLKGGFEIVVRPHFETMKRSPEVIEGLREAFGENPSFRLEEKVKGDELLINSDVLVCDWSGVALKYALGTERPVLFIDVPAKINNPNYKELELPPIETSLRSEIGLVASPKNLSETPALVSKLIAERDSYKDRLVDLRDRHIFSFGKSAEVGGRYIVDVLLRK